MAHIFEPRVRETASTTLTADFVLAGAMRGSLAFSQVMATGDTCDYVASYDSSFEEGLGTMQADGKLARTSVYRARHANGDINTSKVSFAAGVKTVIMTFAASRAALMPDLTANAVRVTGQSFTSGQRSQARDNIGALLAFPAGTKMLFVQTAAPTGWTKDTSHNDKALRVVSGTASSGGSSPFSTVFGKTATDAHTLIITEVPAHSHGVTDPGHGHTFPDSIGNTFGPGPGVATMVQGGTTTVSTATTGITIQNAGGGGSHTHPMDIRVNYVDCIIATKD